MTKLGKDVKIIEISTPNFQGKLVPKYLAKGSDIVQLSPKELEKFVARFLAKLREH